MNQKNKNLEMLDIITILGFVISVYALFIGLRNLEENREQSNNQQDLLNYLEGHLQSQDKHLHKQDELIKNLTK